MAGAQERLTRRSLTQLPRYIIVHFKRFVKNTQMYVEKNPTIVNFPLKNLDFSSCCTEEAKAAVSSTRYDLVANIVHEGQWKDGVYKVHVLHQVRRRAQAVGVTGTGCRNVVRDPGPPHPGGAGSDGRYLGVIHPDLQAAELVEK